MIKDFTKIISVEDNDFDFELIERKLNSIGFEYEIRRAMTEDEFRELLDQFPPDLILSDFTLPIFSGLEALKIAQQSHPLVPFIFVSGSIGEELAVETLIQGANDYVLKDNLNKLEPALKRALEEAKEKARRKIAEQRLEEKLFELNNLVYRISHDFRGPVCSIVGIIDLVKHSRETDFSKIEEYLDLIRQATNKMEWVVRNLSSFQFVYADEFDFKEIVAEKFIADLKRSLMEIDTFEKLDFNFHYSGPETFFGDKNVLFAIFFNLLHNACIYIDGEKSRHYVNCTMEVTDKELNFSVEDNGIGMEEDIKGRIFEMFYRGSVLSRGAGLGLYILQTTVKKYQGSISVNSRVKKGTTVKISLPFSVHQEL